MKRRDVIKGLAVVPLAGTVAAKPVKSILDVVSLSEGPLNPGMQIYQSIGVEPVINCKGTYTIIGASVELPEVRTAMDSAAQYNVQLDELADAVGRRLAE